MWENSQNGKIPIVAIIFTIPMLFPHLDEKTMLPAAFRFIPFDFGPQLYSTNGLEMTVLQRKKTWENGIKIGRMFMYFWTV